MLPYKAAVSFLSLSKEKFNSFEAVSSSEVE